MNVREAILKEHSKKQTSKIVNWVGDSQQRFDGLIQLFLTSEYRVVQRVAWPLSICAIEHPVFISKHIGKLVQKLSDEKAHPAVKRNITRLLPHVNIPVKYQGEVMNRCIDFLVTPGEKAAVKAFSLHILQNLAKQYPDITREVELIILDQWHREPPSFRSRARQFLAEVKSSVREVL
jgi:hypothetical protein